MTPSSASAAEAIRVVGWNCNGGLAGVKAERLAALRPDVAIVSECAADAELAGLIRVGWTGTHPRKGLAVFARPDLLPRVDPSWDPSRQWFLPVHLDALDADVLAVWAMNHRGGEGEPRWRTRRALDHYEPLLARRRAIIIGDFNDNLRWDRPTYPAFAGTLARLAAHDYASLYHALSGEHHGAESCASLYWRRKVADPYLVDHAFVPEDWLGGVERFDIGAADIWLTYSDHMPLIIDLAVPRTAIPFLDTVHRARVGAAFTGLAGHTVNDFWAWAYGNLMTKMNRGLLAEYLVAAALGVSATQRIEWDLVDLRYRGQPIEVKSAGYLQAWPQRALSKPTFDIAPRVPDTSVSGVPHVNARRAACYVFCLFTPRRHEGANPIDVGQWEFFAVATARLPEEQQSLGLAALRRLADPVPLATLRSAVDQELGASVTAPAGGDDDDR